MTDGISRLGRSAVEMNSSADKLKNNKSAPEATANSAAAAPRPQANDEVILSKAAETAMTAGELTRLRWLR